MPFKWNNLLYSQRVRDIFGAAPSQRSPEENRSEFERDYGRAIFSTPVRRLQDKAQVFPLEPNDAVRTRLTHSLEVSTLARSISDAAAAWLVKENEITSTQAASISAISATCGLIHDLGNPPFGHSGEQAIMDWFEQKLKSDQEFTGAFKAMGSEGLNSQFAQDFLRFDGNPQTLRLVSRLQMVSDLHGMNLTVAAMSAACKYVAQSNTTSDARIRRKPGYFASENALIKRVRELTETGEARNPITYLVEAADDLVYSTVDLEDGVKKGALTWEEYESGLKDLINDDAAALELLNKALKETYKKVDGGPIKLKGRERNEAMAQVFRTFALVYAVPEVVNTFKIHYATIMQGGFDQDLIVASKANGLVEGCKALARTFIHRSHDVLRLEVMGRQIIQDLMDIFWHGCKEYEHDDKMKKFQTKIFHLASENYRNVFEAALKDARDQTPGFLPERYCRLQLVTDYICGMTDTFARTLHKRLRNG